MGLKYSKPYCAVIDAWEIGCLITEFFFPYKPILLQKIPTVQDAKLYTDLTP